MVERLKHMKESLMTCIENQINHLENVDTKELGEAIDMVKDLEEAIYYHTITKAMNEKDGDEKDHWLKYYWDKPYPRDMDREYGKMYYDNPDYAHDKHETSSTDHHDGEKEYELMRDQREGRSPHSRRMYMESKEMHSDKATQMRELENYMQELTQDVVEMVEGSTAEEKQYLSKRVAALANKLAQLND